MSTRLPGAKYKDVFDRGRSLKGRLLVGWFLEDSEVSPAAGVIVSKKTFRHAVDRNRAKRLMREAFRLQVAKGGVPAGAEWIFVARRQIADKKVADVEADIAALGARLSNHPESALR